MIAASLVSWAAVLSVGAHALAVRCWPQNQRGLLVCYAIVASANISLLFVAFVILDHS